MNFRRGNQHRGDPEINLIPFIDVLLVILIFLMVTTTYSRFTELQINLPTAESQAVQQRPSEIHIGVDNQGRYKINQKPVAFMDVAGLAEDLKIAARDAATGAGAEAQSDPIIIINADRATTHQSVIDVLEAARLAGLARITFATQSHAR